MLPSSLPLVNLFRRLVARRPDGGRLITLLITGYLIAWASFGLMAYAGDILLHAVVERVWGIAGDSPAIVAALLLLAGVYQFTPLKQLCLDKCRSPYGFLVQHWRGRAPAVGALRLGMRHGMYCVGCCWTLMLLMFAIGGTNIGWMLALGAVMAAERMTRLGRRLPRPLGVALILWGGLHLAGVAPLTR
jgi:predicted metal-binding membrane protein